MQWMACFVFVLSLGVTSAANATMVKVRIKSVPTTVSLSGTSLRFVGLETKFRAVTLPQNHRVDVTRVIVAQKPYWQISRNPTTEDKNFISAQEALMVQGEDLRQGRTELPNQILLRENKTGEIDVIGVVPLEEYVLAVLTNEMPLAWPLETLKAQAVAIRSYTLATLQERGEKDIHVEASVLDQVYRKISGMNPGLLRKARQAVKETEGVILLNLKNHPLKAFYHADCGGRTVPASSVWKQEKSSDVGVAVDPFCAANPRGRWSLTITKEKLQRLLKSFTGTIRSNEFRKLVGFMDLKSTNFEVFEKEDRIEFSGQGFGHGAGLCQWGSKYLGTKGFSYQRILKHYYPLASLQVNSF